MKSIIIFSLLFFLFEINPVFCQSLGVSVGYGFLSMSEVNDDLQDTENALSSAGINTSDPDKISGGLLIEGSFKYGIGKFNIGVSADYVSSSGNFTYNDYSGSFEENYDVSTTEVLGLIEIIFPIEL